jgi:hypothetical protein
VCVRGVTGQSRHDNIVELICLPGLQECCPQATHIQCCQAIVLCAMRRTAHSSQRNNYDSRRHTHTFRMFEHVGLSLWWSAMCVRVRSISSQVTIITNRTGMHHLPALGGYRPQQTHKQRCQAVVLCTQHNTIQASACCHNNLLPSDDCTYTPCCQTMHTKQHSPLLLQLQPSGGCTHTLT